MQLYFQAGFLNGETLCVCVCNRPFVWQIFWRLCVTKIVRNWCDSAKDLELSDFAVPIFLSQPAKTKIGDRQNWPCERRAKKGRSVKRHTLIEFSCLFRQPWSWKTKGNTTFTNLNNKQTFNCSSHRLKRITGITYECGHLDYNDVPVAKTRHNEKFSKHAGILPPAATHTTKSRRMLL